MQRRSLLALGRALLEGLAPEKSRFASGPATALARSFTAQPASQPSFEESRVGVRRGRPAPAPSRARSRARVDNSSGRLTLLCLPSFHQALRYGLHGVQDAEHSFRARDLLIERSTVRQPPINLQVS